MPDDNTQEEIKTYYFTFMSSSELHAYYVMICDTYSNARNRMHNIFGDKWAFQYASAEAAGVNEYSLKLLIAL